MTLEVRTYLPTLERIRLNVKWLNDPDVVRFSEQRNRFHTIKTQTDYEESFNRPNRRMGIFHKGDLIGTISAYIDRANNIADVGIMIGDKTYWGLGFGFQAWKLACDDLLSSGIRKIEAGCMASNIAMIRICQKYDMKEEGRREAHFVENEAITDMLLFGRLGHG